MELATPAEVAALLSSVRSFPVDRLADLSPRRRQVARLVGQRLKNREIAEALGVSEGTVKAMVHIILGQTRLRNRRQLREWVKERVPHA